MPASMAGSRGGVVGRATSSDAVEFVNLLLEGRVGFRDLYERFSTYSCPQNVTLVINNSCNLRCKHCYLQVKELTAAQLREDEWQQLLSSIVEVSPELICLSGKENIVGATGSRLLAYLRLMKDSRAASFRIGLITNGTKVHDHRDSIVCAQPSYFDISLDGTQQDHDALRGQGAFNMALPNVEWATRVFGNKFFVNLTLHRKNWNRLAEAVEFFAGLGVQNIGCGFYRPLPYTDASLALTDQEVERVFDALRNLERISLPGPLSILLDLDTVNVQPLKAFLRSSWFRLDEIQQDTNGECFLEYRLRNGARLEMRFAPYPTGVWRSVRITPEGNYLAAEDTIDTTHYRQHSIANVRDFDFDFRALHAYALRSNRFREVLMEYSETVLPVIVGSWRESRAA